MPVSSLGLTLTIILRGKMMTDFPHCAWGSTVWKSWMPGHCRVLGGGTLGIEAAGKPLSSVYVNQTVYGDGWWHKHWESPSIFSNRDYRSVAKWFGDPPVFMSPIIIIHSLTYETRSKRPSSSLVSSGHHLQVTWCGELLLAISL